MNAANKAKETLANKEQLDGSKIYFFHISEVK